LMFERKGLNFCQRLDTVSFVLCAVRKKYVNNSCFISTRAWSKRNPMSDALPAPTASNTFERIKRVNPQGHEFWSARDLARVLEYTDFRNFIASLPRPAKRVPTRPYRFRPFVDINEMVTIGSGAQRELEDWRFHAMPVVKIKIGIRIKIKIKIRIGKIVQTPLTWSPLCS